MNNVTGSLLRIYILIIISRENNKFATSVYRKHTFSGVFTSFESFIRDIHKIGLFETLLHKSLRLCSNYEIFYWEIKTLNLLFKYNNYLKSFVNHCVKKFLNKLFIKKYLNSIVPQRELTFILPCLRKLSLDLRTKLRRTIEKD